MSLEKQSKSAAATPSLDTFGMASAAPINMIVAHTVCAQITDEFLEFSKSRGNDLSTPRPEFEFPGLVAGQAWCLCASRWLEAYESGCAPKVFLRRSNSMALEIVPMEALKASAADLN
jgi:uncharacterized protein (DUF2237 family)